MSLGRWVALVAVVLAVVVGIVLTRPADGPGRAAVTTTTTTMPPAQAAALAAAVKRANVRLEGLSSTGVADLIRLLCDSRDAGKVATKIVALGIVRPDDVRGLVEGVGNGAELYCPAVPAKERTLLNDVYNQTLSLLDEKPTTATVGSDP